ncbi:adenylyltransferase and sulfurtransferase MOCS3-like [Haliotis rufescens]|uniref:adenylyltransferase and sulfurtransferase MOCS3-like n=1 Tax=Haliotis rufescens TaxID=6454 RepID=UPI00201EC52B|nr:adenylyltransferase and sulfurtransferase MOCS3-like [Haliotis rufescens]XP_046369552.2 adenylyltransferase and sulfurtransferase MOCS3-like [Haliotis rufescens]XP_048246058.1 adenylyltransferase and sulfurtransferase MOCS3-like [Haliotis rufescens]
MEQVEIRRLKLELEAKDKEIERLRAAIEEQADFETVTEVSGPSTATSKRIVELTKEGIARYSRQLILPEIGVQGQLRLQRSSVLIVGAGGLGCPAAIYLAAAGIGKLGVIDYDEVELSNLHRQVLHTEDRVGVAKSASATHACKRLNSSVHYIPYRLQLDSSNALAIISQYDVVLDASDNVATRYLLNDACVLAGKPLVSGSALRFEGQLTVYNHRGGPCYRCLFPKPPPPETVTNCSEGGVLGVVPGIIGCLQALETVKIVADIGTSSSQRLLLFDALDGMFRTIKLRPRQSKCPVCGDNPSITQLMDYEQFCGARATDKEHALTVLDDSERISPKVYQEMMVKGSPHILVDVRTEVEMGICQLPHPSVNIPISSIDKADCVERLKSTVKKQPTGGNSPVSVVLVCRRGNDSQNAVRSLQHSLSDCNVTLKDIRGGLHAWARQVDKNFPVY